MYARANAGRSGNGLVTRADCGRAVLTGWGLFTIVLFFACTAAQGQTKFQSAEEAFRVGAAYYNSRNYAASIEPFEAALEMATDDAFRLKVYEALLAGYRTQAEHEKFFEASHFVLEKADSAPRRSLVRRSLLAFAHQRGKIDELAKRYEG